MNWSAPTFHVSIYCFVLWFSHEKLCAVYTCTGLFLLNLFHVFSMPCSVAQLCPTQRPHGMQHTRLPCHLPSPRVCSNSCPLSQCCHPIISSSVAPFPSCLWSFPASGSFAMGWLFASGSQSIGASASASVRPMNIQELFPLKLTGLYNWIILLYTWNTMT